MNPVQQMPQEKSSDWNGLAGRNWVEAQALLDQMLKPIEILLADAVHIDVGAHEAARVLDIGCGTGGVTLAAARRLGPGAEIVGVDIAAPMIDAAKQNGAGQSASEHARVDFIQADAQDHAFEAKSFDMVVSRFGVMFFSDFVAAFTNLRRAVRKGGALRFVAWRSAEENPFMTAADRAAAPLLPDAEERAPGAPGQFAFADGQRVQRILDESGWRDIKIEAIDLRCSYPASAMEFLLTRRGAIGRVLPELDTATRAEVITRAKLALEEYVCGDEVRFTAACWMVAARAG